MTVDESTEGSGDAGPDEDFREPHLRRDDFLGAFGIIESSGRILMVENDRVIDGRPTKTWDLPGGQVEPGELLGEALSRELKEEIAIDVEDSGVEFAFLQEGERCQSSGQRIHAWRSFFFHVRSFRGQPLAGALPR